MNEKTRGAATQIESPMLRNVREEDEMSSRGAVARNHRVVQEHRGRNLIRHTREHVQIKVKELNLDLHSVNTSRIQLIKTNSSKPASFSVASSGNIHKNNVDQLQQLRQSPLGAGAFFNQSPPIHPKNELRRLESQLMQHSPSGRSVAKKLDVTRPPQNQSTTTLDEDRNAPAGNFMESVNHLAQQHGNSSAQIIVTKLGL